MFKQIKLDYSFDSLEPFIDTHTLGLHYNKHYKNYLNKLNELLNTYNLNEINNINDLLIQIKTLDSNVIEDILFNLGGVLNHELYFKSMSSKEEKNTLEINKSIEEKYGDFNNFKNEFIKHAISLKGSGYTFLVLDNNKNLDIINFPNQVTPYLHGLIPLLCVDLWEHAYYINYENRKNDYLDNFFNIIDLKNANDIFVKNKVI